MNKEPSLLKKGDVVSIISTARKVIKKDIQKSIDVLTSWGLKVVLAKNIFVSHYQFSGEDEIRKKSFQEILDSKKIKAIFCARGGYGTIRIIDKLDFNTFIKYPKWIVGFSDITILHSSLNILKYCSIHSFMPINYDSVSKKNLKSLYTILFKGKNYIQCFSNSFNKIGLVKSEVVGGNLSILYSLLGSKSDICTNNKILLIEDLDEYLYHLDRMIISLKRAGKFNNLNALIVGSMTKIHDNKIKFGMNANEIIKYHTEEFNYPICFDFPVGHQKNNKPLVLGKKSKLDISSNTVSLVQ
tara:strand:+ start:34 stop:930 length:897 start_codon:yes stop_codon:yes gene_type:complete